MRQRHFAGRSKSSIGRFDPSLLTRLRGFEGWNLRGVVKIGLESQKSALHGCLWLSGCDRDPWRRLRRQLQLQSLQQQLQIRLRDGWL